MCVCEWDGGEALWDSRCVSSSVNKVNKSGLIRLFLILSQ